MKKIGFANEETAVMELSRLYSKYGFRHYKMSKFEEYELYSQNKDFLIGNTVLAFTDTNGALMALNPDVTLSIVKNSNDTFIEPEKVYYSENVYRVDKGTHRSEIAVSGRRGGCVNTRVRPRDRSTTWRPRPT